jgi:hypothetical protein
MTDLETFKKISAFKQGCQLSVSLNFGTQSAWGQQKSYCWVSEGDTGLALCVTNIFYSSLWDGKKQNLFSTDSIIKIKHSAYIKQKI